MYSTPVVRVRSLLLLLFRVVVPYHLEIVTVNEKYSLHYM